MYPRLRNFARYHDPIDFSAHLSDVWANAQRSRIEFIRSYVLAAWRRASTCGDRNRFYPRWSRSGGHQ
jgi:hypothetical protein